MAKLLLGLLLGVTAQHVAPVQPIDIIDSLVTFGTGLSAAPINKTESTVFQHTVQSGNIAIFNHFWITGETGVNETIIRYYIDGETTASIEFKPPMACGMGPYPFFPAGSSESSDKDFPSYWPGTLRPPWGTEWIGKGSDSGGWYNNIKIPFYESVRVTTQLDPSASVDRIGYYIIVRGTEASQAPLEVNGMDITSGGANKVRLALQKNENLKVQPLDFVSLAKLETGTRGLVFATTLAVQSGDLNFLEGCFHLYDESKTTFPGTMLSTGTEDFFDSAYYFNAGLFAKPVSGFTNLSPVSPGNNAAGLYWSAYRFFDKDPLMLRDGGELVWRNGDEVDPVTFEKCFTLSGGSTVGNPTVSVVDSYAWVYTWPVPKSSGHPQ